MAKKRVKTVEPESIENDEFVDDNDREVNELTCTKRYTISRFVPEKSSVGCKSWKDFFETDNLSIAKREAEKVVQAENIPVSIWDREKWGLDHVVIEPEVKEDENVEQTQSIQSKATIQSTKSKATVQPKPKHKRSSS